MSKNEYKVIKDFFDKGNSLFDTEIITIGLVGINDNSDSASARYKVDRIYSSEGGYNEKFKEIRQFISKLNDELTDDDNTGFKKGDHKKGWSIFFLIKECIQFLSKPKYGFNYYRGQRDGSWLTIPSAFRDLTDDKGNMYFSEFENIYKEVHKKYPEKVTYIELPEMDMSDKCQKTILKRGQQLALLQHYDLYTPLLDITANPYIALLFMTNGKIDKPQLEFYDIHTTSLFMEPDKTSDNSRILAQKGAFLNYELLLSKVEKNVNLLDKLKEDISFRIPRLVLKIEYLEKETEEYNTPKKELELKDLLSNNAEFTSLFTLDDSPSFSIQKNKLEVYQEVQAHIRRKLYEFNYFEDDLFPDFEDLLKSRMKKFIQNIETTPLTNFYRYLEEHLKNLPDKKQNSLINKLFDYVESECNELK